MTTYYYNQQANLSCLELFFWIAVDKTMDQLGVTDIAGTFAILAGQPIIPTRAKFKGATKGTSAASIVCRRMLNYELKMRLPMLTGASIRTLRIALTRNLGAFVGRTIPFLGWIILAKDAAQIMWNTVTTYNMMVTAEDRLSL